MSNINPLFILLVGATILSLVLVTTEAYSIFAQEEEEKDKEEDKDEEKEKEDKDEESKDKDEDEKEEKDEEKEDTENNNDTATQTIQDQLTPSPPPPPINNDTTIPIAVAPSPPPPPPPQEEKEEGEFNATCQCKTTSSTSSKPKPTPPPPPPSTNEEQIIIPISTANIHESKSFGQVTDPAYTSFYAVPNLLDSVIDDVSFWSQAGPASGFYIQLDNTLDNYQVCSAELNVHNPKSTPYILDIGVSQNYTGVIDQTIEKIQFNKCVKNMDEIYMTFDSPSGNYISISEIKLFGSKLTGATQTTVPPTLQPHSLISPNAQEETENATKINIENSNAEIDIKNSTVTFKFDPMTATFVQQQGVQ